MSEIHQLYCAPAGSAQADVPAEGAGRARILAASTDNAEWLGCLPQAQPNFEHPLAGVIEGKQAQAKLVFLPQLGGLQWIGCVHPGDSGGCFAHVLLRALPAAIIPDKAAPAAGETAKGDEGSPGEDGYDRFEEEQEPAEQKPATAAAASQEVWSALDALRLWNADGWTRQTPSEMPATLPAMASLQEVFSSAPAIDDAAVERFLTEPGDVEAFEDLGTIVPQRWQTMPSELRVAWFNQVLSAYLQCKGEPGKRVVVVAEPSIAALLFYGVARLLPPGPIRNQISFSTLEACPGRSVCNLVGFWSDGAALPPDVHASGIVIDTRGEPGQNSPVAQYAAGMVARLCERGWRAVDRTLDTLVAAGVSQASELEPLADVDQAVTSLMTRGAFPASPPWTDWPLAMNFLKQELSQRLASLPPEEALGAILGGPAHLTVIDLLTSPKIAHSRKAVVHLLQQLPPEKTLGLLRLTGVSDDDKIIVLARYIHSNGDLPPGCEFLWEDWVAASEGQTRTGAVLMAKIVAKLPAKDLRKFFRNAPYDAMIPFVTNALRMHKQNRLRTESLSAVISGLDEPMLLRLLRACGDGFLKSYPANEPAIADRLAELLYSLPKTPTEFKERLAFILAGQHLFVDDAHRRAAEDWDAIHQLIPKVANLQKPDPNSNPSMRITLLVSACRDMAKAADQAMSLEPIDQHMTWSQKRDALLRIAQEVLGAPLFLKGPWEHDAILERIGTQLQHHRWPMEPLKRAAAPAKKDRSERRLVGPSSASMGQAGMGVTLAVFLGMGVVLSLIVALVYFTILGRDSAPEEDPGKKRRRPKAEVPAGARSSEEPSSSAPAEDNGGGRKRAPLPSSSWLPLPQLPQQPFDPLRWS